MTESGVIRTKEITKPRHFNNIHFFTLIVSINFNII